MSSIDLFLDASSNLYKRSVRPSVPSCFQTRTRRILYRVSGLVILICDESCDGIQYDNFALHPILSFILAWSLSGGSSIARPTRGGATGTKVGGIPRGGATQPAPTRRYVSLCTYVCMYVLLCVPVSVCEWKSTANSLIAMHKITNFCHAPR